MRTAIALMLLATALAVPGASASDACDGPGTAAEACYDTGSRTGGVHERTVSIGGCIVSVNDVCVPDSAAVNKGAAIAEYELTTFYVGVDVNVCPVLVLHCSYSVDTDRTTAAITNLT